MPPGVLFVQMHKKKFFLFLLFPVPGFWCLSSFLFLHLFFIFAHSLLKSLFCTHCDCYSTNYVNEEVFFRPRDLLHGLKAAFSWPLFFLSISFCCTCFSPRRDCPRFDILHGLLSNKNITIGPSGVRTQPLGCRHKHSGHT